MKIKIDSTGKSNVVMNDWIANFDKSCAFLSREDIIYQLMLLSLFYDRILISDEAIALSYKMADYFTDKRGAMLLEQLFELNNIFVLKHPYRFYREFKDDSNYYPIKSRGLYVAKYGTRNDEPFNPSTYNDGIQLKFYDLIDDIILRKKGILIESGERHQEENIMEHFRTEFEDILSDDEFYSEKISDWFPGIIGYPIRDEFLKLLTNPNKILYDKRINKKLEEQESVVFNRSLAFQYAKTFIEKNPQGYQSMTKLIQSIFAKVYNIREEANGQYGKYSIELPEKKDKEDIISDFDIQRMPVYNSNLNLPKLDKKFSEIILDVSANSYVIQLKKEYKNNILTLERFNELWGHIAEELASKAYNGRRFNIKTEIINFGKNIFFGVLAEFIYKQSINPYEFVPTNAISGTLYLASSHITKLIANSYRKKILTCNIKSAIDYKKVKNYFSHYRISCH